MSLAHLRGVTGLGDSQQEKAIFPPVVGFPGGSVVKDLPANAGDMGSTPGSERSPGEGNGSPSQYSCLEKSMDRGTWQATVHGVAKSQTRWSDVTFTFVQAIP